MKKLEIVHYLRPRARKEIASFYVGDETYELAQNQIITCESGGLLLKDKIVFYSRLKNELEEDEQIKIAYICDASKELTLLIERVAKNEKG